MKGRPLPDPYGPWPDTAEAIEREVDRRNIIEAGRLGLVTPTETAELLSRWHERDGDEPATD